MEQRFLPSEQARPESRNAYDVTTYRVDDTSESVRKKTEADEVDRLMVVIHKEARRRSKRTRGLFIFAISQLLLIVASILIPSLAAHRMMISHIPNVGPFVSIVINTLAVTGVAVTYRQKEATAALARQEVLPLAAVGPLIDAQEFQDREVVAVASERLLTLLPLLRASDARLITQKQRQLLNRQCLSGKNTALTLAILKAYQQVGDAGALPTVQRLAEGEGRSVHNRQIQQAAKDCLPNLLERVENATAEQQLLRGASEPAAIPETLLRPATGSPETPSSQLLRAEISLPEEKTAKP